MRLIINLGFLLLLTSSCINEDFPALELSEDNIFGGSGPDLFTVVNIEQSVQVADLRRVRVEFTSVYNDIPLVQREAITGIAVITPNRGERIDVSRTHFVATDLVSGTEGCFALAFTSSNDDIGFSRMTEFCVMID